MLDLNNDEIKSEGGSFDPSKIFGFSIVENDAIVRTLDNVMISGFEIGALDNGTKFFDINLKDTNGNETNITQRKVNRR